MELGPILTPVRDLGEYIREQRTAAQISLRALASKAGVSNPYLSQVERGLRRPSAGILSQIAQGLSISTESLLIRAGILQAVDAPPVVHAIRADESLSERQKSALIDIYQAFRAESAAEGPADERPTDKSEDTDPHGPAAKQSVLRTSTMDTAGDSAGTSTSKHDREHALTTRTNKPARRNAPITRIATTRTSTTRTSTTQPSHTGPAEEGNDHVATH